MTNILRRSWNGFKANKFRCVTTYLMLKALFAWFIYMNLITAGTIPILNTVLLGGLLIFVAWSITPMSDSV